MTAAQLVTYATSRILNDKINFDIEETKLKILYLGQLRDEHFFVLSLSPIDAIKCINVRPIKNIINVLTEIGFIDTRWTHISEDGSIYTYYMYIPNEEMIKL